MRLAVLGEPVAHSLSPALHTAALAAAGIPGEYVARTVDAHGLAGAVDELRHGELDGANVTMPHKHLAAELCDDLAATARRVAAVNTMVRVAGRVIGHNTDIAGVLHAWTWAELPRDAPVLILGAGGAAAAAAIALQAGPVTLSTRRLEASEQLMERLRIDAGIVPFGHAVPGAVVVNATPLGMRGERLPPAVLEQAVGVFDMAYGPDVTPAIEHCRQRGLAHAEGTSMLLGQAVESFRLWVGRAPLDAMRTALESAGRVSGVPT